MLIHFPPVTGKDNQILIAAALRREGLCQMDAYGTTLQTALRKGTLYIEDGPFSHEARTATDTLSKYNVHAFTGRCPTSGKLLPGTPVWGPFGEGVVSKYNGAERYTVLHNGAMEIVREDEIGTEVFLSAEGYDRKRYPHLQPPRAMQPSKPPPSEPLKYLLFKPITSAKVRAAIIAGMVPNWVLPPSEPASLHNLLERGVLPCPVSREETLTALLKQFAHPVTDVR